MDKDRIKGSVKQAQGSANAAVGKATGDKNLQAKGQVKKAEGALQKAFGKFKDVFRNG